jgi:UDPglucose 6-dehydrogenase
MSLRVVQAVEDVNEDQKHVLTRKIVAKFGDDLKGKHFAVWGLAFKPDTDDMREATSVVLINDLLAHGATVTAYDPVAMPEARRMFGDRAGLSFASDAEGALPKAHALVIVTEWKEFARIEPVKVKQSMLESARVFDGRNLFAPAVWEHIGVEYAGMGRAAR